MHTASKRQLEFKPPMATIKRLEQLKQTRLLVQAWNKEQAGRAGSPSGLQKLRRSSRRKGWLDRRRGMASPSESTSWSALELPKAANFRKD